MTVLRTWKRDGVQTIMALGDAVRTLQHHGLGLGEWETPIEKRGIKAREKLLAGCVLETKCARFQLATKVD